MSQADTTGWFNQTFADAQTSQSQPASHPASGLTPGESAQITVRLTGFRWL